MTNASNVNLGDPLEFVKSLWGNMGFSLPGMVAPTVDTDELGKRIADLKAVEGWLKSNLNLLQMTIQGLEMQRATLLACQQMGQAAQTTDETQKAPPVNPFLDPAAWQMPWDLLKNSMSPPAAAPTAPAAATATKPKRSRKKTRQGEPQR